jgi:hypothetical protein
MKNWLLNSGRVNTEWAIPSCLRINRQISLIRRRTFSLRDIRQFRIWTILNHNSDRFTEDHKVIHKPRTAKNATGSSEYYTMEYPLSSLAKRGRRLPLIDRVSAVAGTRMLQREIPWCVAYALDKWLCHGLISISYLFPQARRSCRAGGQREGEVPL